jgi:hypothetical protein
VLIGILRIVATYTVFSQTVDEPMHLAAGMEWLDRGRFDYEAKHPPLPRVTVAVGPYLDGLRSTGERRMLTEGNRILEARGTYARNLALARAGTLPFFIVACIVVWAWSRRLFGVGPAVASVGLFTLLPPVLAHSGLATTDMALAAMLPVAILAFTSWLERPSVGASIGLGILAALAVLSKISAVVLLPACALAIIACKWIIQRRVPDSGFDSGTAKPSPLGTAGALALVGGVAMLTIWAGYRFSITRSAPMLQGIPVPAFEFAKALYQIQKHNALGHPAYLLGQWSQMGWWYFFPVTLAVKTPLPFLVFTGLGLAGLVAAVRVRPAWQPLAPGVSAAVVLAVSMTSNINNGVRHVLPAYTLLAVYAGFGAVWAWNLPRARVWSRAAVASLTLWLLVSTARTHPDYLAYFNELAGGRPERIVVNSDLCWGQDYFRLVDTLRARGIDSVWVAYHGSLDVDRHRLPGMRTLPPYQRVTGWVAASARELKGVRYQGHEWIEAYPPVTRVGRSMWLFYVPPDGGDGATPKQ